MNKSISFFSVSKVLRHLDVKSLSKISPQTYSSLKCLKHCPNPISTFSRPIHNITSNIDLSNKMVSEISSLEQCTGKLSESLSPEQEERLTQIPLKNTAIDIDNADVLRSKTSTRKKFKLKAILDEIEFLERAEFPLPTKLEDVHWQDLLAFENRDSRTFYFDALNTGTLNEKKKLEIFKEDAKLSGPLILPQKVVDEIVAEGDQRKINRLDEIKHTYDSMWQSGASVHPIMGELELIALMEANTKNSIPKTIYFIRDKHNAHMKDFIVKRAKQAKGVLKKVEYEEKIKSNKHIIYGLAGNTIFFRISEKTLNWPDKNKTIREFNNWGQPLVIDLSFVKNMSFQQAKSLFYRELPFAFKFNAESKEPFAVYLTNYDSKCAKCSILTKGCQNIMDIDSPVFVTEKPYLELFPPQQLLYLTPDSKNDLVHYDPNDIYIIGGLIDTTGGISSRSVPHTLSAAKKQNIRHARLPMKRTLGITKELNVDHVVGIMADFKFSKDWLYSFRWVPARSYRNRLKSPGGYTPRMEAVYMAHKELSPTVASPYKSIGTDQNENGEQTELSLHNLVTMSSYEYRRRYKAIVEDWIKNAKTDRSGKFHDEKYMWNNKRSWQEKHFEGFEA